MKNLILALLDLFYPLFRRFMPLQAYRYAACGGGNTLLDIVLFTICFKFIFKERILHTPIGAVSPHIASFIAAFCVSFPLGFYLNKTFVFTGSTLRGRVQLFRYFVLVLICIILNYVCLKFFVDQLHINAILAKVFTTVIVVAFSFLTQKHFTFKVENEPVTK